MGDCEMKKSEPTAGEIEKAKKSLAHWEHGHLVDLVAQALHAHAQEEREKCAVIAETLWGEYMVGHSIAKAIRNQS